MPKIVASCPEVVYSIVGATHPLVKRHEGEVYRESLAAMAQALGVSEHVRFVNRYLSLPDVLGTFAGLRRVRYPLPRKRPDRQRDLGLCARRGRGRGEHALPVRRGGSGRRAGPTGAVRRQHCAGRGDATIPADDAFRAETRRKAYAYATPMFWPNVGRQYLDLFNRVVRASRRRRDDHLRRPRRHRFDRGQLSLLNQEAGVVRSPIRSSLIDDFITVYQ